MNFRVRHIRPVTGFRPIRASVAPRRLRAGDRVAIVSPASPYRLRGVLEGATVLKRRGLTPVFGRISRRGDLFGLYCASIEERVEELRWAFSDPDIAGVFCSAGGLGSAQLLPFLPYSVIAENPKVLVGSSDITALTNGIWARTGVITFDGEMLEVRWGRKQRAADRRSLREMVDLLKSRRPWGDKPFRRNHYEPACVVPGWAEGLVLGGNLSVFTSLLGTPYFPDTTGAILFLEDQEITTVEFARMLTQLEMAGVFDRINGVVLGGFTKRPDHPDSFCPTIDEAIVSIFKEVRLPCVTGLNFSHQPVNATLPIGGWSTLDAEARSVEFGYPLAK
jgi:muramoyltetrapeptide carboxypeptidase